jgi:hypothetical protein
MLTPAAVLSSPIATASINGSWELRTACTNNHGKPGSCIEMKQRSLVLAFSSDGNWNSAADDQSKTKRNGGYEIHKERLILKNTDGSLYQDWRPNFSADGQSFVVEDRQLIETFVRVTN